jgi:hypothetical protein
VVENRSGRGVPQALVEPLLQLDLPSIEGTTLNDYCRILADEPVVTGTLQTYLRQALLNIDREGSGVFDVPLARITAEISQGVADLRQEMRRLSRRSALQAAGAVLASVSATLVAVEGANLAPALAVIGAGGGVWGGVAAMEAFVSERSRLKQRPSYLLWLLDERARNA